MVAVDLLHFDWYQQTLRATYPALQIPGPFPWPETLSSANPSRAVCYIQYSDKTEIDCSPAFDKQGSFFISSRSRRVSPISGEIRRSQTALERTAWSASHLCRQDKPTVMVRRNALTDPYIRTKSEGWLSRGMLR